MIVVGYKIEDAGWGHKYRRVTDPEQRSAIRSLTKRTHVKWSDVKQFEILNVFFHEHGHPYPEPNDTSPTGMAYYTHMRGEHADGATQ
jgi:hypothetical protein